MLGVRWRGGGGGEDGGGEGGDWVQKFRLGRKDQLTRL